MSDREWRQGFLEAEVAVRELAGELARTQQTRQEVESLAHRLEQLRESLGACQGSLDRAQGQLAAAQGPLLQAAGLLRDATQRIDALGSSVQRSVAELSRAV